MPAMTMMEVQQASSPAKASIFPQPKQASTSEPRGIRPTQSTTQHTILVATSSCDNEHLDPQSKSRSTTLASLVSIAASASLAVSQLGLSATTTRPYHCG